MFIKAVAQGTVLSHSQAPIVRYWYQGWLHCCNGCYRQAFDIFRFIRFKAAQLERLGTLLGEVVTSRRGLCNHGVRVLFYPHQSAKPSRGVSG